MPCFVEMHKSLPCSKIYISRRNISIHQADTASFFSQLGEELSLIPPTSKITTYTDNISLHDSANTTSQILDCRIRLKMSAIREIKRGNRLTMHKQRKAD